LKEEKMKMLLILLGLVVAVSGCAKEADAEEKGADTQKAAAKVEAHSGWITDYEKAMEMAKAENKHILINFSGSDWCGWCIRLDKEVLSQQAFKDFADENLVLMLADFPRDKSKQSDALKKQNEKLAEKYGVRGFPTVFILDPEGNVIDKTGYQEGGAEAYVDYISKVIASAK
jgi:protein disulfide-isomerase